jgi:heme-degrading monooxygenase HmoA
MIARVWRGATRAEDAEAYLEYLDRTGHPGYRHVTGHRRTMTLRRLYEGRAEFVVMSFWDSLDAIRAFAGADVERAVFYPEDDRYLVEREDRVAHFDVVYQDPGQP